MKQYDLSAIMSRAWAIFRKGGIVCRSPAQSLAERQSPPTERGSDCSSQSSRRDCRGLQNMG